MKFLEVGFIGIAILNMFFWSSTRPTFISTVLLRFPPIHAFIKYFALGAGWDMFSNPGPNFAEIKVTLTFADGSKHAGYYFNDKKLIEAVGATIAVHRFKYSSAILKGGIPPQILANKIVQGFQKRGHRVVKIKMDHMLINCAKFPSYEDKVVKTLVDLDLTQVQKKQVPQKVAS